MDAGVIAAIVSAIAAIIASAAAIFLTKKKEREALWRAKKLDYYEEFFAAASGIVAYAPDDAKIRFASAVNNLHLIGAAAVISALHDFTDEIAESNQQHFSKDRHDQLWSLLVWEIRADLDDPPTHDPAEFVARLWASGVQRKGT